MDKETLVSYISDIFDAAKKIDEASGALTSYIGSDVDDAYWDTLDQIKDGEFDSPEEAADAILEVIS